jgi:hypothetical protein
MKKKKLAWLVSSALVAAVLAIPGIASAHTTEAIAETGGFMLTLPGVGVNVAIDLDQFGMIEAVDVVDPAAPPVAETEAAGTVDPAALEGTHRVRFELADDGTRLSVMAKNHKLTGMVKADGLESLLGPHEWSAVLFPELPPTTVRFDVGEGPMITVGDITGPDGIVAEVKPYDDDDEGEAGAVVTFTWDGYTKTLKIKVSVDDDDEDDDGPSAVLKVELRAKDRQRLENPDLGSREWSGLLCDGTPVGISYEVLEGSVDFTSATIDDVVATEGFTVREQGKGFQVRFDGSKARVSVRYIQQDGGTWHLKVDSKTTEKCKHDRGDGEHDNDDHDGERHDGNRQDKKARDDRNHDRDDD